MRPSDARRSSVPKANRHQLAKTRFRTKDRNDSFHIYNCRFGSVVYAPPEVRFSLLDSCKW